MKFETLFNKHTDIISDSRFIVYWSFDIEGLKRNPDSGDYTAPVRRYLFKSLSIIAHSGNRRIRERSFTIFAGDHEEGFSQFGLGIRGSTDRRVKDILLSGFEKIEGFLYETNGLMPYTPFIPCYRYIHGNIIEYTFDEEIIGKKYIDDIYGSGLKIKYRTWLSSETEELKPRYIERW